MLSAQPSTSHRALPPHSRPLDGRRLPWVVRRLRDHLREVSPPVVTLIAQQARDPFRVLVSTMLSARTKDDVTATASARLFAVADDPAAVAALPVRRLERLIFPVGFYRTKARNLKAACRILVERFGGRVPDSIDALVELPGVGRKTANLVLIEGFAKPAMCVDTHVHRICNLWGLVETRTPAETETALRRALPRRYWLDWNRMLVSFGQHTCVPISPRCSRCPIEERCPRIGVARWR
ncbi:MAG TPA: endonuclease III [Thermoanaerobaculia bacterium]|nr:endonuclease III [Thermoanaerobaculia bacterium]